MWDGHPLHRDRGEGACAQWCDTDFFKGSVLSHDDVVEKADTLWGDDPGSKWCVLTGGEPLLQIDVDLMAHLASAGWMIAIETNGTVANAAAESADWVCVAPKLDSGGQPTALLVTYADEVKVVVPGVAGDMAGWTLEMLDALRTRFMRASEVASQEPRFFVQAQDPIVASNMVSETHLVRTADVSEEREAELARLFSRNLAKCIAIVKRDSRWSLSFQTHKVAGLQ